MNLESIDKHQARMWKWHQRRFPDATKYRICLKAAEELGEVAEVVIKDYSSDRLVEEVGDVLNVLSSLLAAHGRKLSEAIKYASTVPDRKGW